MNFDSLIVKMINFRILNIVTRKLSSDNILVSRGKPIDVPKITLPEVIWKILDKSAHKTATECLETKRSYTYEQLYKKSLSLTRFLRDDMKFQRQETVAVLLPNIPEYPIVLFGAIQAGLKVTTINTHYTAEEINRQLVDCGSRMIFTLSQLVPVVQQATKIPVIEIRTSNQKSNGTISFDEVTSKPGDEKISGGNPDDVIFLPFSSGTTGLPKGVILTHSNLVANLLQLTSPEFCLIQFDYQWVIPAFLPFCHIYGLTVVLLQSLLQGSKLVTMSTFSSSQFLKVLRSYKVDAIFGVPPVVLMMNKISDLDLRTIRFVTCGGAPLHTSDLLEFHYKTQNKVTFLEGFGMTETSGVATIQTHTLENGIIPGSCGLLLPNTQAKVIPIDGTTAQGLPPGQEGELILKGPQITKGYLNNPKATESTFIDGWLKTGDLVYCDEYGHFYITGRLKELIKVKGFHVAPSEIEQVMRKHPKVEDCAVIGVPDPITGEAPKAFVVVKSAVSAKEIEEYVAKRVAYYKSLRGGVVFVQSIPRSPIGKILRRILQNM